MKRFFLIILMLAPLFCHAQENKETADSSSIHMHSQGYYVTSKDGVTDTVNCLVYSIKNLSSSPKIMMFTEDNVNSMTKKQLIRRKCFRKYGDFSLSCWAYEEIINNSKYVSFPGFFVKIIKPGEIFTLSLLTKNMDDQVADLKLREHMLICSSKEVENEVDGFIGGVKYHHADYQFPSLTISWDEVEKLAIH